MLHAFPGRLLTEILAEVDRLPVGYLEELLEVKAYVQAFRMVDAADTKEAADRLPKDELVELAKEIALDLAQEWREQHG